jgi:hypothetical protein
MSIPSQKLRIKNPFKTNEEKLITAIEQQFSSLGRLPTCEELITTGAVGSQEEFTALLKQGYVQNALEILGININPTIPILEPIQLAVIQVMFDFNDTRSSAKKLRDMGVSGQTWQNWLRDPVVQKFCQDKAESLFTLNQHEIDQALFNKARTGQVDAIKLYLQLTGRLRTVETVVPKVGNQDSHYFLIKVYEAIQEVLADEPELMRKLATRLKSISNPFMGETVVTKIIDQPAIEAPQPINPVIQQALHENPTKTERFYGG